MPAIPTFVINLKHRADRRQHIQQQFEQRTEFDVKIIEAHEHAIGSVGLWNTIKHILLHETPAEQEYILICEDDHEFTSHYSKERLFEAIAGAQERGADILSGGVSWFNNALAVSQELMWVEQFSGFQFTIIFRHFFTALSGANFLETDETDYKVSAMSVNKFFLYPFISVQKEFGYSDVTPRNNEKGRVEHLFNKSLNKANAASYIAGYYNQNRRSVKLNLQTESYSSLTIPTYIINLPERTDRLKHIQEQFANRPEFDIKIIEACKHEKGAIGLWMSIRKIIEMAVSNDDDVIIICEDDHMFTSHYSKERLLRNIMESYYQRVEVLSGGIGGFDIAYPVTNDRFWINAFYSTQFLVLYKPVFQKILNRTIDETITADGALSEITNYKMTLFPFISIQKEFGYSDVTAWNVGDGAVDRWFISASNRLELTSRIYEKHCAGERTTEWSRSMPELMEAIQLSGVSDRVAL